MTHLIFFQKFAPPQNVTSLSSVFLLGVLLDNITSAWLTTTCGCQGNIPKWQFLCQIFFLIIHYRCQVKKRKKTLDKQVKKLFFLAYLGRKWHINIQGTNPLFFISKILCLTSCLFYISRSSPRSLIMYHIEKLSLFSTILVSDRHNGQIIDN